MLSTKNVGFFPDNFVEKEAQRQNVGNFAEKMKGLSGMPEIKFFFFKKKERSGFELGTHTSIFEFWFSSALTACANSVDYIFDWIALNLEL